MHDQMTDSPENETDQGLRKRNFLALLAFNKKRKWTEHVVSTFHNIFCGPVLNHFFKFFPQPLENALFQSRYVRLGNP